MNGAEVAVYENGTIRSMRIDGNITDIRDINASASKQLYYDNYYKDNINAAGREIETILAKQYNASDMTVFARAHVLYDSVYSMNNAQKYLGALYAEYCDYTKQLQQHND